MTKEQALENLKQAFSSFDSDFYQTVAENARDVIFVLDPNGLLKYVNSYGAGLFGTSQEELIGKNIKDIFTAQDYEKLKYSLQKIVGGKEDLYKEEGFSFNGKQIYLGTRCIPKKDSSGKVVEILGFCRDITMYQKAREDLDLERKQLLSIFDGIDQVAYIVDPQTYEILYCNKALADSLPNPISLISGQKCYRVFQNLESPCSFCTNDKIFGENVGNPYIWETQNNNNQRWYHCIDKAIRWPDGRMVRCEIAIDITQKKMAEEEMIKFHAELEQKVFQRTDQLNLTNKELLDEISERKELEEALHQSEEKYRGLVENVNIGVYRSSPEPNGRFLQMNFAHAQIFGFDSIEEFMGVSIINFYQNPEDRSLFVEKIKKHGLVKDEELKLKKKDGSLIVASVTARAKFSPGGEIEYFDGVIEDITERKNMEESLRRLNDVLEKRICERTQELALTNQALQKEINERNAIADTLREKENLSCEVLNSIQDGVSVLDNDLNILLVNQSMEKWYAHAMPLVGKKCYLAYHGSSQPCKVCPSQSTLQNKQIGYEMVPKRDNKNAIIGWQDLFSFPFFNTKTGELQGVIEYVRDITERKKAEEKLLFLNNELVKSNEKLKQLSLIDSHTGLFNHHYLVKLIDTEFHRARRYAHPFSVTMLDIDYFKSINDVYGHHFGDLVLKQFARQLKKLVRRYDIVVRFGGEEFVVVSPGSDRSTALMLAEGLLDAINLFNFGDKKHTVKLKLSISVVSYPQDKASRGTNLIELADKIVDKIKETGGNKVCISSIIKERSHTGVKQDKENSDIDFLRNKVAKLTKKASQNLMEAVFAFAKTIKVKDHYTGEHVEKTVQYATEIAKILHLPQEEIEVIRQAAILHDLGKIGISERILNKKTRLTPREFAEIKKHPQIGVDIIRPIQFLRNIIPSVLYHHERWDGRGYPNGLKGEEIPLSARIVAIADVYQALGSDRPYRKAFPADRVIQIINEGSGTQFDPQIVNGLMKIIRQ
jgi:diguanylate cyclase (GGDEF)-like protein/PAS domain S-box-containing protein